jgi:hypothetical protein
LADGFLGLFESLLTGCSIVVCVSRRYGFGAIASHDTIMSPSTPDGNRHQINRPARAERSKTFAAALLQRHMKPISSSACPRSANIRRRLHPRGVAKMGRLCKSSNRQELYDSAVATIAIDRAASAYHAVDLKSVGGLAVLGLLPVSFLERNFRALPTEFCDAFRGAAPLIRLPLRTVIFPPSTGTLCLFIRCLERSRGASRRQRVHCANAFMEAPMGHRVAVGKQSNRGGRNAPLGRRHLLYKPLCFFIRNDRNAMY